ncbi:uncharacterized protein K441DRAFT_700252 [Cenococcum geophilum 1.58]|uniref:uncharacterized protein n=1 Tax=Cenococcum geophilum 1.58 TaxID=794803 RepID=UPI00358FFEDC|nr:hypothetical protein K441DRAFT_700252 [Cenococcum geophilum 1.58]
MKLSSVVALFSVATSALGEKPVLATSDGSTAEAALTPNFSALSQNALNQLSSLVQKSSIYLADTAISAYQASFKSCLASADCNKFSTEVQEKLREAQDGVLAIDYNKLSTDAQEKFREVQDVVFAIDYKNLPTDVTDWIIAHPYQTAFHVAGGVVFFAPGLVSTPLLGALGWTSIGPRAASVAAGIQATLGTGAAGGIFATLESAAMGGYGVAPVAWSTRAGVGAFQAASWVWGGEKQKAEDAKDESGAETPEKSNS